MKAAEIEESVINLQLAVESVKKRANRHGCLLGQYRTKLVRLNRLSRVFLANLPEDCRKKAMRDLRRMVKQKRLKLSDVENFT